MSKKLEIFDYEAESGKTWDAYSLREMLEALNIPIPQGKFPMAIRLGGGAEDFAICFWDKRGEQNKPSRMRRKGDVAAMSAAQTAPIMAQPLATISPEKALLTRLMALLGEPAIESNQTPAKAQKARAG